MGGALFSGLLSGFGGVMQQQKQQDHEDAIRKQQAEINFLGKIDPTTLDAEGKKIWAEKASSIFEPQGKGGKQGKSKEGGIGHVIHSIFLGGDKSGPPKPPQQGSSSAQTPDGPPSPQGIGSLAQHMQDPEDTRIRNAKREDTEVTAPHEERQHKYRMEEEHQRASDSAYTAVSGTHDGKAYAGETDVMGNPVTAGQFYNIKRNRIGQMQFYPAEAPKPTATKEKREEAVAAYQSAHPGTSPEQALTAVRKREDVEATLKIDSIRQRIANGQLTASRARLGIQKLKEGVGAAKGDKDARTVAKGILAQATTMAKADQSRTVASGSYTFNLQAAIAEHIKAQGYDPDTVLAATAQGTSLGKSKSGPPQPKKQRKSLDSFEGQ